MSDDIRSLELCDLDTLATVHKACFHKKAWSKEKLKGTLVQPSTRAYAYWKDERLAAFLLIQDMNLESEILSIGTHPDFENKGIAKKLIRNFIETWGEGTLFLEVASDNKKAIALYESLGFSLFSWRRGYYVRENGSADALNYRYISEG